MKKLLLSTIMLAASVMLKAQNPYPILPIDSVQFVNLTRLNNVGTTLPDYITPFKDSTYYDTVRFEGIVVMNPKIYGLATNTNNPSTSRVSTWLQRKGGGPWSGVQIMLDPSSMQPITTKSVLLPETKFYDNCVVGYKVLVTGVIREFSGETQVNLIRNNTNWDNAVEQVSLIPDTLVYTEIEANQLMTGNPNTGWVQQKATAEQYEGTLVKIRNVSVYSIQTSGNRSFWSVIDDYGNILDVRDASAYFRRDDNEDTLPKIPNTFQPPAIGTRLEYIQGLVTEYAASGVQRYGIIPIYPTDYKVCSSCPPVVKYIKRNPIVSTINDTLNVTVEITVGDTTLRTQYLYYTSPATPNQLDSVLMTAVPLFPNYYVGKVNPTGVEGVFTYWVRAEDKKSRQTFFPDPLTLGKSFYVTANGVNSIQQLQYSNSSSGSTIWDGDSLLNINVGGVVTSANNTGGVIVVQNGQGPNSAIFIQKGNNGTIDTWKVGDSVQITRATVAETFNSTNLYNVLGSVISSGNALPSMETSLSLDSFALNNVSYSRKWEGVLVHFDSVKVNNTNPDVATGDFGEFSVIYKNSAATTGLRVDDLSLGFKAYNKIVKVGMMMGFIQGPMNFANGNFKLIPRDLMDVDLSKLDSVAPVITLLGANPDTIMVGGVFIDPGATAMDDIDGNITANIVVTGTVNTSAVGLYVLTYKVSDAWGNADSVKRIVLVMDTTSVGINENELNFAQLNVYPNPATSNITVTGNFIKTQPVTISVVDILGKEVVNRTVRGTQFTETINTDTLNNGVYFCRISNASGSKTLKFMVSGK